MRVNHGKINNSDVYALGVTKNYVVINDDYTGVSVLDKELSFIKNIVIDTDGDFMIYQLFSTELNDYIVIQDIETEKIYSINLETNQTAELKWDIILTDFYCVEGDSFYLKSKKNICLFNYETLKLVSESELEVTNQVLLVNCQKDLLFLDDKNRMIYNSEIIDDFGEGDYEYKIEGAYVIRYSEKNIYLHSNNHWQSSFEVREGYSIRTCLISFQKIYVLLNNKEDINESEIKRLDLRTLMHNV